MLAFFLLEENHRCDTDHISIPLFSMVIALVSTEIVLHSCDIAAADMRSKREDRKLFFYSPLSCQTLQIYITCEVLKLEEGN